MILDQFRRRKQEWLLARARLEQVREGDGLDASAAPLPAAKQALQLRVDQLQDVLRQLKQQGTEARRRRMIALGHLDGPGEDALVPVLGRSGPPDPDR